MEFFDPTFDPSIKEDAYLYNRMPVKERNEYNKKYNQYMLAQAGSSEEEIIRILKKFLPEYKEIHSKLALTGEFRFKSLKKEYEKLEKEKNELTVSSAYIAIEKNILTEYLKEDQRTAKVKMENGSRGNEFHLRNWVDKQIDKLYTFEDQVRREMKEQNISDCPVYETTVGEKYLVQINFFDFIEYSKLILVSRQKNPIQNMRREKAEKFLEWATAKDEKNEEKLIEIDNELKCIAKEILKSNPTISKTEIREIEHELYVYTQNMNLNSGLGNKLKAYLEYGEKTPFKEELEKSLNAGKNAEYRKIRGYYQLHSPLVVKHLMDDLASGKIKFIEKQLGTEME